MKKQYSYGIIPLKLENQEWRVLLVKHLGGHWSFPKGRPEKQEQPLETAKRELKEETGLEIKRFLSSDPLEEQYIFTFDGQQISKTVAYFLAVVEGEVTIQEKELCASQWLSVPEAFDCMTFDEGKRICLQVSEFLKTLDSEGRPLWADF